MHQIDLIPTLTACLSVALGLGYVTHRLGLSPVVGYLLAGLAVGPNTPGFVADGAVAEQLAEIGVVLLMFGVGLHFHVEELLAVRAVAVPGALVQGLAAGATGAYAAHRLGYAPAAAGVFGLALSIASTAVLTRVLAEARQLHTRAGHVAVGWLIVQDVLSVLALVLLPALFGPAAAGPAGTAAQLALAAVKVAALVGLVAVVGRRVIPAVLRHMAATRSRELFTLAVLAVALGVAVGSSKVFGVSAALGAFLAGMVVGRSDFSTRAATEALPMRDAFAVLFFVSVGTLLDPALLVKTLPLTAAALGAVVVVTPLSALAVALATGHSLKVALTVAAALAQIGEFSFIIAGVGRQLGILADEATHVLAAVSVVTISLNPLLVRLVAPAEARIARLRWLARRFARREAARPAAGGREHRAVLVGYGPVGRTLARLLRENGVEPTVVELNPKTVEELRGRGGRAVYGDATHHETLRQAGVEEAGSIVLSASGLPNAAVIRAARELNPAIRVLARTAYIREGAELLRAGADAVFAGEGEVALAMTESVLRELGATPDQIDRERERVRGDLVRGHDHAGRGG